MLVLKDLTNRVYKDKQCVSFEHTVIDKDRALDDEQRNCFVARWTKGNEIGLWNIQVVLDRTRDADSQVYRFGYVMPRDGLPLELIAATGLKYFQLYLQQEVQIKSNYNFVLSELLKDM